MCRSLIKGEIPTMEYLFKNKPAFIKNKVYAKDFNKYQRIYESDSGRMLEKLELDESDEKVYTLKTLGVAFYALKLIQENKINTDSDYKKVQLDIVNCGGDTDTNAAVAGQILGAHLGYSKLPKDWLSTLIHKNWLDKKIIRFFDAI
jgi:ADP-ribosyl-[dinitrogen reductase] hydrolase